MKRILLLLLACSLQSFAQMGAFNYSSGYTFSDADNRANWAAHNTWVAVPGAPTNVAWITVAANPGVPEQSGSQPATILVGDTSRVVHQFTEPTVGHAGVWGIAYQYGSNLVDAGAGKGGVLWGMAVDTNQCPSGYYVIYSWNNSTSSWDGPIGIAGGFGNGCLQTMAVAADGTLVGANPSNGAGNSAFRWNGTGWDALPGGPYLQCAAQDFNDIFCLTADQLSLYKQPVNTHITTPGFKMNQIVVDQSGQMLIHRNDTQPNLYRNTTGGSSPTWVAVSGGRTMTVATGGANLIYGFSGNTVYHISPIAKKVVGSVSGNGTCTGTCSITHSVSFQDLFGGNNIGNSPSVHNGPYSDFVNLSSTDYEYNPWDYYMGDSQGEMSQSCNVDCSATGSHDCGNGTVVAPPLPCEIPPQYGNVWSFETVTVYFDANYFSSGWVDPSQCPGPGANDCFAWLGIHDWNHLRTGASVTYVSGGLLSAANQCYDSGLQDYYPCSPSGSYIFLTKNNKGIWCPLGDAACTTGPRTDAKGHRGALTTFAPTIFSWGIPNHAMQHLAAHEEGHNNGINDCFATDINCTASDRGATVMWSPWDGSDTYVLDPTFCDTLWANIYRPF